MNYVIRNFKDEDYEMICSWWNRADMPSPSKGLVPNESTFIFELESKPVLSIAVYFTNTEMAYLENFIANPDFKSPVRKQASKLIVDHAMCFAKGLGFTSICCFAVNDKTAKRYEELGMRKTVDNLKSFIKELV